MTTEAGKRLLAEFWREDGDGVTAEAIAAIEAEAVATERKRLRDKVEGLRVRPFAVAESGWQVGFRQSRNETVDAILAIIDAPPETTP